MNLVIPMAVSSSVQSIVPYCLNIQLYTGPRQYVTVSAKIKIEVLEHKKKCIHVRNVMPFEVNSNGIKKNLILNITIQNKDHIKITSNSSV